MCLHKHHMVKYAAIYLFYLFIWLLIILGKMAMSKAQKNLFVTNRVYLINNIIPGEEFFSHLRAGNHMTEGMQDEIMVCAQSIFVNNKQQSSHFVGLYFSLCRFLCRLFSVV